MNIKKLKSGAYFLLSVGLIRVSLVFLVDVKYALTGFQIGLDLAAFVALFLLGLSYLGEET